MLTNLMKKSTTSKFGAATCAPLRRHLNERKSHIKRSSMLLQRTGTQPKMSPCVTTRRRSTGLARGHELTCCEWLKALQAQPIQNNGHRCHANHLLGGSAEPRVRYRSSPQRDKTFPKPPKRVCQGHPHVLCNAHQRLSPNHVWKCKPINSRIV